MQISQSAHADLNQRTLAKACPKQWGLAFQRGNLLVGKKSNQRHFGENKCETVIFCNNWLAKDIALVIFVWKDINTCYL